MIMSARNKPLQYECPICGYDEMSDAPEAGEICPCCGTQFDSADFDRPYHELRGEWIDRYMPWFSRGRKPPKNWSPYRQLIIAGHGIDLVTHPRLKTDEDYRYAVEEAFSDVRIAKQLKTLRDARAVPLTQAQLAQKAEMKQSRISELEGMDYSSWSVSTLRRLARALGVRFMFGFESWGDLVPEIAGGLSRRALFVPSFEDDPAFKAESAREEAARAGGSRWDELQPRHAQAQMGAAIATSSQRRPTYPRWTGKTADPTIEALLGARREAVDETEDVEQNPLALAAAGSGRR